jgi:hypothetical protein
MSARSFVAAVQRWRTKVRWWTVGNALMAVVVCYVVETGFVDYSHGYVNEQSPLFLWLLYRLSFLASLLLGIFTFPRWYSFLSLAAFVSVFLVVGGR